MRGFVKYITRTHKDIPIAAVLLAPSIVLLGVFGIAPLFMSIYLSLLDGRGAAVHFAGLANYYHVLQNEGFWESVLVTIYYVAGTVPITLAISYMIASGLFHMLRFRGLFRTLYFLPYVTSVVAAATIWRVLLHPQFGPLNTLIGHLGVDMASYPQWLNEPKGALHLVTGGFIPSRVGPSLALCCIILFDIWHNSGFMVVILLAGLTAIPKELEEAATIDGAGWLHRTRHVVLPLLSPTLFFLLIVSVIRAFQGFNSFYALTGDGRGPYDSTQNVTVFIFSNLYVYQRVYYGAAAATLLAVAIVLLTLVQWRYAGRRVHYE